MAPVVAGSDRPTIHARPRAGARTGPYPGTMRRPVLALVLSLAMVALVLVGGYLADGWARARAQTEILDRAGAVLDDHQGLTAQVRGGLFIPQLVRKEAERVDLAADSITVDGTTLEDVRVLARDIDLGTPVTAGDVVADARVPLAELQEQVDAATADSRLPLTLAVEDGRVVAALEGVPVAAPVELAPDGSRVRVTLTDVRVGPVTLDAASLAGLLGRDEPSFPVSLPLQGLEVDGVEVVDDALRLRVSGRQVDLGAVG